ncbi:MAG: hypothetical protein HQ546_00895 [Planctomycetes bacterium]|nr:hypothetical protein [Planctomycetota bacterium]
MVEKERQSDIVDDAFETLLGSHLPEGPSLQALEQTLQAVHQAQQKSNRISLVERIKNMNKHIKYPIAAAIALAALAGGAYLLLGRSAGIAFADVRQKIEQAQTMTFTAIAEMKGMNKPIVQKTYFKSPGLMRLEITVEGNAATAPGTTQTATASAAQKVVSIFDITNQKSVTLFPDLKMAMVYDFKTVLAETLANDQRQNLLEELKKMLVGEHEELGEKTIDGQKAKGYRCKNDKYELMTNGMMTMDIWANASTGNIILVEMELPEGMGKFTMTDFVMDPKFDDSLFDTRVPEGYSTETQTLDLNFQESDLIKGLSLLVKCSGDVFPKGLMLTPGLDEQLKKAKMSIEERHECYMFMSKIILFQVRTIEFVYAGEGVKLGDKATPILWYKVNKDAKMYRVIYGDLHAEDAEKAPKHSGS